MTIRSNIKGREPQLPTTLSSPVTKDNFMIIEFSENDKKNFNKASTIQDAYAEWERSLDLSSIPCPSCSAVGCLCRYDHYDRFLICSAEDIDDPAYLIGRVPILFPLFFQGMTIMSVLQHTVEGGTCYP